MRDSLDSIIAPRPLACDCIDSRAKHNLIWYTANVRMRPAWSLLPAILACACTATGCRQSAPAGQPSVAETPEPPPAAAAEPRPPSPPAEAPDIVLITLDTVRADHVDETNMPFLARFSRDGVLFTNAQTMFSETGPAHASIFTGLQPHQHGIVRNCEKFDYPGRIPMTFYKAGYQTAAFVSAVPVRRLYGFAFGFEVFNDDKDKQYTGINTQRGGRKTVDAAVRWLAKRDNNKPLFLWVHLFDPHAPYDPEDLGPGGKVVTREELDAYMKSSDPIPDAQRRRICDMYRRELRQTDDQVERIHEAVVAGSRRGVLWTIMADHGEELFDHENFAQHDKSLYQGVLHVPLVMRWDGHIAPRKVEELVNSGSVAPTLLTLTGHKLLPNMLPPLPLDDRPPAAETVIVSRRSPHGKWTGGPASAVRRGNLKAIFFQARKPELYDLSSDPREERNLAAEKPELLEELRTALTAAAPMTLSRSKARLDAETQRALEELGYTSGD